mmetsp:Transcript_110915/g.294706  ORF Transcript_110915/g.294706 Transcript_110915/m.294706 type:complete len:93 (-) Transcript_110915:10-288(-)
MLRPKPGMSRNITEKPCWYTGTAIFIHAQEEVIPPLAPCITITALSVPQRVSVAALVPQGDTMLLVAPFLRLILEAFLLCTEAFTGTSSLRL